MSKFKSKVQISKADAADRLDALARQLRSGQLNVSGAEPVSPADAVEFETELKDDKLEVKIGWQAA